MTLEEAHYHWSIHKMCKVGSPMQERAGVERKVADEDVEQTLMQKDGGDSRASAR